MKYDVAARGREKRERQRQRQRSYTHANKNKNKYTHRHRRRQDGVPVRDQAIFNDRKPRGRVLRRRVPAVPIAVCWCVRADKTGRVGVSLVGVHRRGERHDRGKEERKARAAHAARDRGIENADLRERICRIVH